ncbi:TM protein [Bat paramyxovirus]|nr:TM protein [Bat paramyxovirus]
MGFDSEYYGREEPTMSRTKISYKYSNKNLCKKLRIVFGLFLKTATLISFIIITYNILKLNDKLDKMEIRNKQMHGISNQINSYITYELRQRIILIDRIVSYQLPNAIRQAIELLHLDIRLSIDDVLLDMKRLTEIYKSLLGLEDDWGIAPDSQRLKCSWMTSEQMDSDNETSPHMRDIVNNINNTLVSLKNYGSDYSDMSNRLEKIFHVFIDYFSNNNVNSTVQIQFDYLLQKIAILLTNLAVETIEDLDSNFDRTSTISDSKAGQEFYKVILSLTSEINELKNILDINHGFDSSMLKILSIIKEIDNKYEECQIENEMYKNIEKDLKIFSKNLYKENNNTFREDVLREAGRVSSMIQMMPDQVQRIFFQTEYNKIHRRMKENVNPEILKLTDMINERKIYYNHKLDAIKNITISHQIKKRSLYNKLNREKRTFFVGPRIYRLPLFTSRNQQNKKKDNKDDNTNLGSSQIYINPDDLKDNPFDLKNSLGTLIRRIINIPNLVKDCDTCKIKNVTIFSC